MERLKHLLIWLISGLTLTLVNGKVGEAGGSQRVCYWCGPRADQVHSSRSAPSCEGALDSTTTCDTGYNYCALLVTTNPYAESRMCIKSYNANCYPAFCNSTNSWRMTCPCEGNLCNGNKGEREDNAIAYLLQLFTNSTNAKTIENLNTDLNTTEPKTTVRRSIIDPSIAMQKRPNDSYLDSMVAKIGDIKTLEMVNATSTKVELKPSEINEMSKSANDELAPAEKVDYVNVDKEYIIANHSSAVNVTNETKYINNDTQRVTIGTKAFSPKQIDKTVVPRNNKVESSKHSLVDTKDITNNDTKPDPSKTFEILIRITGETKPDDVKPLHSRVVVAGREIDILQDTKTPLSKENQENYTTSNNPSSNTSNFEATKLVTGKIEIQREAAETNIDALENKN